MVIRVVSFKTGTVPVAGGHLAWHRTGGSGPALVLSHGLTDNGLCWSRFAEAMAVDFDVIMLDARGHGDSARMPEARAPDPGRDLVDAIDALGLAAPIVMGHSVGARATAAFAAANPGRVGLIILEDPPLLPLVDDAELFERRRRFRQEVARLQSMSLEEITAYGRQQAPGWHADEFTAWAASKLQADPECMPESRIPWQQDFAAITVPTLLICGEAVRGALVTPELAAEATALNANIRTVRIDGAGHNVRRENFAGYVAAVRSFLRDHGN
jgi:N-formylmaleamate deformylase